MKMKILITYVAVGVMAMGAFGQDKDRMKGKDRREAIQAQKVAFITQKLELSPEEAQKFWPVYNQCQKELAETRKRGDRQSKGEKLPKPNIDEMSDKEVEDMMNNDLITKRKAIDIHELCINKYKEVLPIKKVAKLHDAEKQFRKELLNKMRDRRENTNKPPRPPR
jgi:hypothetical protein